MGGCDVALAGRKSVPNEGAKMNYSYYEVWLRDCLHNWCSPLNNRFSSLNQAIVEAQRLFVNTSYVRWEVRAFTAPRVVARGIR
jgi:hypothetical protein